MPNLKKGPDRKSRCSLVNVKVRARCCISAHSFKTRYVRSSSRVSAQDPSEDLRRINTLSEFAQDPFSNPGCTTLLHDKSSESLSKRSEEHTSELQSHSDLVCRLLLEKK